MSASTSAPDLSWLADSPMFIDGQQIGAFYDAVVGPAFRTVELQITAGQYRAGAEYCRRQRHRRAVLTCFPG